MLLFLVQEVQLNHINLLKICIQNSNYCNKKAYLICFFNYLLIYFAGVLTDLFKFAFVSFLTVDDMNASVLT